MTSGPLRILLVDYHPVVLVGIKAIIGLDRNFTIIGEARDGLTGLRMATELRPDVVVLDIALPELDGIELAATLHAERPEICVLVFTEHEERAYLGQLLELGVRGYLLKRSPADEMRHALQAVAAGAVYLDAKIADRAVKNFAIQALRPQAGAKATLSEGETNVLRLTATGHSNNAISSQLSINVNAVQAFKVRAMEKLGIHSRADVMRYAIERGWLQKH
jgi:DNA-binding NarL/FixJ family response regulator